MSFVKEALSKFGTSVASAAGAGLIHTNNTTANAMKSAVDRARGFAAQKIDGMNEFSVAAREAQIQEVRRLDLDLHEVQSSVCNSNQITEIGDAIKQERKAAKNKLARMTASAALFNNCLPAPGGKEKLKQRLKLDKPLSQEEEQELLKTGAKLLVSGAVAAFGIYQTTKQNQKSEEDKIKTDEAIKETDKKAEAQEAVTQSMQKDLTALREEVVTLHQGIQADREENVTIHRAVETMNTEVGLLAKVSDANAEAIQAQQNESANLKNIIEKQSEMIEKQTKSIDKLQEKVEQTNKILTIGATVGALAVGVLLARK